MQQPQGIPILQVRIVVLALASGTLLFTAMLAFLRQGQAAPLEPEPARVLTLLVPFLALANLTVYFLLRRGPLARARAERDSNRALLKAGRVPREFLFLTIIGAALAESVGLFGAIAYFLGGPAWLLASPALAVGAILALFPGLERFEQSLRES